ncbi:hypothetical protein DSL72_008775 [Monilinia vaccinii-corymbosi]|uniref:FAD-binding PCMH-type domain-containing protein n=1 Tax=Monilinia vaccinii-corymbosi TaxID=61207 RepID=A0A8A3PSE8_9HELO|nr:hypothetical protein DSL72_008775 [Monilinia vaccinii-corymbosi]
MGADIQAFKVYEFAQSNDVTVVGGECRTVDVAGEHVIGGGHWPLSSIYGMTADQILAIEVVNPDGRFVTVSASENTDLYWALRGGSGSTFGVVTSLNCKVYPVITSTVMTFSFEVGGVRTDFDYFTDHVEKGIYGYSSIFAAGPYAWSCRMQPFSATNYTAAELDTLVAPWVAQLNDLGNRKKHLITTGCNCGEIFLLILALTYPSRIS